MGVLVNKRSPPGIKWKEKTSSWAALTQGTGGQVTQGTGGQAPRHVSRTPAPHTCLQGTIWEAKELLSLVETVSQIG